MHRPQLTTFAAVFVAVAVLAACGDASSPARADCPPQFDSAAWFAAPETSSERQSLAEQLVRCRYLKWRSKRDVQRMLGRPERLDTQSRGEYERRWTYYLGDTADTGYGPGHAINLAVVFDKRLRVRRVTLSPLE